MGQEWEKWTVKNTASTVCEDQLHFMFSPSCTQNLNIQRTKGNLCKSYADRVHSHSLQLQERAAGASMASSLNSEDKSCQKGTSHLPMGYMWDNWGFNTCVNLLTENSQPLLNNIKYYCHWAHKPPQKDMTFSSQKSMTAAPLHSQCWPLEKKTLNQDEEFKSSIA